MPSFEHQTRPTNPNLVARNITALHHKEGAARLPLQAQSSSIHPNGLFFRIF
jgi:hypothetical protein